MFIVLTAFFIDQQGPKLARAAEPLEPGRDTTSKHDASKHLKTNYSCFKVSIVAHKINVCKFN